MSLSSDEVNFLVYRYLLEAGFTHAAFVFGCESTVSKAGINGKEVPVGALVTFIQKGFQYLELEANLNEEGSDVYGEYTPLSARDILTGDVEELRAAVRDMKERQQEAEDDFLAAGPQEIPETSLRPLSGHAAEVLAVAWCPAADLLASASADGTARIWDLQEGASSSGRVAVCAHAGAPDGGGGAGGGGRPVDVSALEWSPDGQLLATGATDSAVRIWGRDGSLRSTLEGHQGPPLTVRWNRKGDLLLSGSLDAAVIVWDARSGSQQRRYNHHKAAVVEVDWRNNSMFASCSQDRSIAVCKLQEPKPLKHWQSAHSGDINSVRWDPTGKLLASCSDDGSVKVWAASSDKPLHTLSGHKGSVPAVRWGQSGSGRVMLASCSDDGSVRVWDPDAGTCIHHFAAHDQPVQVVAWSPDAAYLASGDAVGRVNVWSLRTGSVVRTLRAPAVVYDLRFSRDGSLLAACTGECHPILVADLRRQQQQ